MAVNQDAFDGQDSILQARRNHFREYSDLEATINILKSIQILVDAAETVTDGPFRNNSTRNDALSGIFSNADELIDHCRKRIEWMDALCCIGFEFFTRTGRAPSGELPP